MCVAGKHKCTHAGCGYSADKKSDMERHERTHTGEKVCGCCFSACARLVLTLRCCSRTSATRAARHLPIPPPADVTSAPTPAKRSALFPLVCLTPSMLTALQVRDLRQGLQRVGRPEAPRAYPHRRKGEPLPNRLRFVPHVSYTNSPTSAESATRRSLMAAPGGATSVPTPAAPFESK